jgi:hypothetical protein
MGFVFVVVFAVDPPASNNPFLDIRGYLSDVFIFRKDLI